MSIFLHPDWDDVVFNYSRTLYSQAEDWVEFIVRGPSVRSSLGSNKPLLTPHPFILEAAELDRQGDDADADDEPGAPLRRHKLGGRPYFVRYNSKLVEAIQQIEQQGFQQLFQLAFPGPKDGDIDGDWPFGDGQFYIFYKRDKGQYQWYYGWLY